MAKELISPEEALKMWLGCVKRLNEPGYTPQDVKRIRLILTALKGYIIVCSDYYERIRNVELRMKRMNESLISYFETRLQLARTEEEKAEAGAREELERKGRNASKFPLFSVFKSFQFIPENLKSMLKHSLGQKENKKRKMKGEKKNEESVVCRIAIVADDIDVLLGVRWKR
ncbi:hypothetical protein IBX35_02640 [Candidatus Bathyarchaeota archaeon]|nr:hypothetical protein [Candidatus Bathyarchaeota archaeon]